ncbi:MAG TPA: ABC transporter permease [Gemmatimonadaceae bacterium]|nr:ABC transporter permease [Gemmatimonadaceae bacterium]
MDTLLGDVRFAIRSLGRRPAFALVVITTIAVAIGATTTMMSVVNAALVSPLPFPDAERLVVARGFVPREQSTRGISYLEAMDWQARSHAFDGLAAYDDIALNIGDPGGDAVRVDAEIVSEDFFRVIGAGAARGRTFLPEEHRVPDAHPVAVIGHGLWQSRFGGMESVVGRPITVNSRTFTIVGVMPEDFRGLSLESEIWIPMMMASAIRPASTLERRSSRWLYAVGRMKPGLALPDVQRDLDRVTAELERAYPATNRDRAARVVTLRADFLGTTEILLRALFGAVGFLLLIACANVMSLQLVRATARRREMAMRVALGAGRPRIVRQLVVEGIVLALMGAAAGVLLALWGVDTLLPLAPAGLLPPYADVKIDWPVLGYTALIAVGAGVLFGLAPALARPGAELVTALKTGAPSAAAGLGSIRRLRPLQVFVIGEVALALVLLAGATLMVRSLRRQLDVDPGFRPDGVVAARLALPLQRYPDAGRIRFAEQLVERIRELPGVSAAAIGADLPLRGNQSGGQLTYDGAAPEGVSYAQHRVSTEYFATLGIPLQRGRVFTPADGPDAPRVAVVGAAMARRLWPDRDPIGQRLGYAGTGGPLDIEVVGVVGNARFRDLTSDLLGLSDPVDVYFPFAQQTDETINLAVRTESDPASIATALRRVVRELDPTLPLFDVAALSDVLEQQTAAPRFGSLMLTLFAAIAMVLAAVGIYGLLAFVVGTSRRDIAIRMALGAASGSVLGLVIRKGMSLAAAGAVLGILIAVPSTRVLSDLLFGVEASDPVTMAGVAALLLAVSLVACWLPARRASRVAPHTALKLD